MNLRMEVITSFYIHKDTAANEFILKLFWQEYTKRHDFM